MHKILALLGLALAAASPVAAQIGYHARVGVVRSTRLVQDVIAEDIVTKAGTAPAVMLGVSLPLAPRFSVGVEAAYARAGLSAAYDDGRSTDLGGLGMGSLMVELEGPIATSLRWRGGLGVLRYLPSEKLGMFARGGATRYLVGGGADFRRPALRAWDLMVSARYDYHRFTTDELAARGFGGAQGVHRVSLSVGLARSRS
jgi:hypothetical protein